MSQVVEADTCWVRLRQEVLGLSDALLLTGGHIPAEERLFRAQLIVDLGHHLPVVALGARTTCRESKFTAWIGRARQELGELHRRGTKQRRIDTVIRERRPQCDRPPAVARR